MTLLALAAWPSMVVVSWKSFALSALPFNAPSPATLPAAPHKQDKNAASFTLTK